MEWRIAHANICNSETGVSGFNARFFVAASRSVSVFAELRFVPTGVAGTHSAISGNSMPLPQSMYASPKSFSDIMYDGNI